MRSAKTTGAIELVLTLPTINVGAAAYASSRSATIPASPTRASTITGSPSSRPIGPASVSAVNSVEPPAGNGIRSLIEPSCHERATVDVEAHAGDVAALVAREEEHRRHDFLGPGQAPEGHLLKIALP